jgi:tetratricopeptide (TPR) repeat protein
MKPVITFIILVAILGVAVYANSLNGKFIWDDDYLIKDNAYIRNWSNIKEIFTKDIAAGADIDFTSYRPIQILSYAADYSTWKLNPKGYHITNMSLHITVALLVFWLINLLFNDRFLSFLTAAFFVIHPVHTAAVSYISGRADSLAALFLILSFILYIKALDKEDMIFYLMMLLSYTLALLSRESAIILPILLLFYHFALRKKLNIEKFVVIAGIAFAYILLRLIVIKTAMPHTLSPSTFLQRMPGFFAAITNYMKILFMPLVLPMEYGDKLFRFSDPKVILGIAITAFLLFYAVRKKCRESLVFFSIGWFFIALLPQSNLYPVNAYMAEHWLYLPSIGFFLALAHVLERCATNRRPGLNLAYGLLIIFMLVFYSFLTIKQNNYWKEPVTFYERTLELVPDSWRMHNNLGNTYSANRDYDSAISSYKKAIELHPGYAAAYFNLGNVYKDTGDYKAAIDFYKKAIDKGMRSSKAYNNLGVMYEQIGRPEEAVVSYNKALTINPDDAYARNNLKRLEGAWKR